MIVTGEQLDADSRGSVSGVIGPILKDSSGNLLILTSREFAEASVEAYQSSSRIGYRPNGYFTKNEDRESAVDLVAWLMPDPDVPFDERCHHGNTVADSATIICGKVKLIGPSGDELSANITHSNAYAQFDFEWLGSKCASIEGLFRLSVSDSRYPDFPVGWSGALVTTLDNHLLGLVIAAVDNEALIAPLDTIMTAEGLSAATLADLQSHNADVAKMTSRSASQNLPDPIEKMRRHFGMESDSSAETILERWIRTGYELSKTSAFADATYPFKKYFEELDSDAELAARLGYFELTLTSADLDTAAPPIYWSKAVATALPSPAYTRPDKPRSSFELVALGD